MNVHLITLTEPPRIAQRTYCERYRDVWPWVLAVCGDGQVDCIESDQGDLVAVDGVAKYRVEYA